MTTQNVLHSIPVASLVFCFDEITPRDSEFGIVLPVDFWRAQVSDQAVKFFEEQVLDRALNPVPLYSYGYGYRRFCFHQEKNITVLGKLFGEDANPDECLKTFKCFTYADGCRYFDDTLFAIEGIYLTYLMICNLENAPEYKSKDDHSHYKEGPFPSRIATEFWKCFDGAGEAAIRRYIRYSEEMRKSIR